MCFQKKTTKELNNVPFSLSDGEQFIAEPDPSGVESKMAFQNGNEEKIQEGFSSDGDLSDFEKQLLEDVLEEFADWNFDENSN